MGNSHNPWMKEFLYLIQSRNYPYNECLIIHYLINGLGNGIFSTWANKEIRPAQLPEGLKILHLLSNEYNHFLEVRCFPAGLQELNIISYSFNQYLSPGLFPESLRTLNFQCPRYSHKIPPGVLPESLESLSIITGPTNHHPLPAFPRGLKFLSIDNYSNFPLTGSSSFFPPQLRVIKFLGCYNRPFPLDLFPASLEEIEFWCDYNQIFSIGIFPPGIKKILLGNRYNQILPVKIFPEGIREIEFSDNYQHPLEVGLFPPSVRKLKISTEFPLPMGIFPEGLESIEMFSSYNHPILPGLFPSTLRCLIFHYDYYSNNGFHHNFPPLPLFLSEFHLGYEITRHTCYYGKFPLSSLPPYFHPDSSVYSPDVPHRLESVNVAREFLNHLNIPGLSSNWPVSCKIPSCPNRSWESLCSSRTSQW